MSLRHVILAVLVALIWGFNFVPIKVGLESFPPFLFVALRFILAAIPLLPFYRSPGVPWRWVVAIGMTMGVGQFSLLYTGMYWGMPAGLTSALMQTQVIFTTLLAALFLGERPRWQNLIGIVLAFSGVAMIAGDLRVTSLSAFFMVLGAAACWAAANVVTRAAGARDPIRLMVWVSLVPPLPMLALSWALEGRAAIVAALTGPSWNSVASLAFVAFMSTIVAYALWCHLLRHHPAAVVAPYSQLIVLFGLAFGALLLGERPGPWKLAGAALIVAGVAANTWTARVRAAAG